MPHLTLIGPCTPQIMILQTSCAPVKPSLMPLLFIIVISSASSDKPCERASAFNANLRWIIRQQASCWLLDGWKLEIRSGVTSYDKGSLNIKNLHHLGTASWTPGCNCQIPNPNPTSSFATCLSILRLWRCRHWEAHPNPFREMRSASTPGIQSARCSLCRRQRNHLAGPNGHSTEVYIRAHHKWDQY